MPRLPVWLVDGYNTLHCLPGLRDEKSGGAPSDPVRQDAHWWSTANRERLVALARCFADPNAEIRLVFDGPYPAPEPGCNERSLVSVHFTPCADDWIVKTVRSAERPERVGVVTRDRQVADRARHHGAVVLSPQSFLQYCAPEDIA